MDYKGSVMKRVALFLIAVAAVVAMVACQGAVGKTGEPGKEGPAGPPGPTPEPPEPENRAPFSVASGPLTAPALVEEGPDETMVVSGYFRDPDGDALTYDAVSSDSSVVGATVAANDAGDQVLTLSAEAAGMATVTVTATDPDGASASITINVTVHAEGMAPPTYDESLDDTVALVPGGQKVFAAADVEAAFDESEGEPLTFTAGARPEDSSIVLVIPPKEDGTDNTVTITALTAGDAKVTITATDSDGLPAMHTIDVMVRDTLSPLRTDMSPGDLTGENALKIGGSSHTDDVAEYFNDQGLGDLTYAAAAGTDEDSVSVSLEGSMLTIAPAKVGTATVTITATNSHDTVGVSLTINVTVVGTPPMVVEGGIPAQTLNIGQQKNILLDKYVTLGEGSVRSDLDYDVSGSEHDMEIVSAEIARGSDNLKIEGKAEGETTITVIVMDEDMETAELEVMVTVSGEVEPEPEPEPEPTTTKYLQARNVPSDGGTVSIDLSEYFSGAASYRAGSNNEAILMVSVAGHTLTLAPVPTKYGTAGVTVTPVNSEGVAGSPQTFDVTVQAEPALKMDKEFKNIKIALIADGNGSTADVEAAAAAATMGFELSSYVMDPDGEDTALKFTTTTDNPKVVAVYDTPEDASASAFLAKLTTAELNKAMMSDKADVTIRGRIVGETTITVTATDAVGLTNMWSFDVTVVATANTPPSVVTDADLFPGDDVEANTNFRKFATLADAGRFKSTDTASKTLEIDLGMLFNDADIETTARTGDSWTFEAKSSDDDVVTVRLVSTSTRATPDRHNVVVTPVGSGDATIYFVVTDSFGASVGGLTDADNDPATPMIYPANSFFNVKVNHAPVARGGQTPDALTLAGVETYLKLTVGDTGDTDLPDVRLVDDPTSADTIEGYFSDGDEDYDAGTDDEDILSCRFNMRGANIFGTAGTPPVRTVPDWDTNATPVRQVINLSALTITAVAGSRTTYLDVWCSDGFEDSPMATLTLAIESDRSIR